MAHCAHSHCGNSAGGGSLCTLTVQANAILAAWLPFARLYLICHTKTATLQLPGPSLVCTVVPIALGRLDANQPNLLSRVCPFTPQSADTQSGNEPPAPTSNQETPSMLRSGAGGLRINEGGLSNDRKANRIAWSGQKIDSSLAKLGFDRSALRLAGPHQRAANTGSLWN